MSERALAWPKPTSQSLPSGVGRQSCPSLGQRTVTGLEQRKLTDRLDSVRWTIRFVFEAAQAGRRTVASENDDYGNAAGEVVEREDLLGR